MEQLTKQQIILLALLVSFVSSIASGIVTVSLMEQSTPGVTQTINRVVERTIQTVTPTATTTKETIIVKEDQAIVSAVSESSKALVRIYSDDVLVALGIITSSDGKIAAYTDEVYANDLSAALEGGNVVKLSYVSRDKDSGISIYQAEQSYDPKEARAYSAALLGDSDALKLGQSVVLIGGREETSVATGIISSKTKDTIRVNVPGGNFDSSAILVNLLGEVIAVGQQNQNVFVTSNIIKKHASP